ncbi:MAG: triose-phosphate isomerase [Parvibaculaceae bacterium]
MAAKRPRALVAGNWKMNGLSADLKEVRLLTGMLKGVKLGCDVMVCPPATLIQRAMQILKSGPVTVGGQDCHAKAKGAHTGDVAAEMLADIGCEAVIVGHSERRTDHGETDAVVQAKAAAAHRAGLIAIVCLGETLDQRKAGQAESVVGAQLQGSLPASAMAVNTVIAYEPVWAIGTGLTPTAEEIGEMHARLRALLAERNLESARILYGGSVKPSNAAEILAIPDVNGALVGGASLKAADFIGIIKAYC